MDLREFLGRLHVESGPNASGEYQCRCPAHDDRTASLCVTEKTSTKDGKARIYLHCQAGCSFDAVIHALGVEQRDLITEPDTDRPRVKKPAAQANTKKPRGKFVCAYGYTDEQGELLFEACRYQREDGSKSFSLRQPDPNAATGWKNTKAGVRLVLYRLPAVLEAIRTDKTIYVVEGEKDCDNMVALGYTATTNPMGAGKWHSGDYTPSLTGADVVIVPDNDKVGREHAQSVAASIAKVAKQVRIVDLTQGCAQLKEKGDLTDFFTLLGKKPGMATLETLVKDAAVYTADDNTQRDTAAEYYQKIFGYCVSDGRICQETQDGLRPLANFVALPHAVVTRDDGVNVTKEMVIDGWSQSGIALPRVHIKAAQFQGMSWVGEHWDFAASIMPGNTTKDKIRYAIAEVGRMTVQRVTEYSHTGWRKIKGKWAYLYQGGAIGASDVTVNLGSGLTGYRLDGGGNEGYEDISYDIASQTTLTLKSMFEEHISIPLLGTIFLAPLREFLASTGVAPAYALFLLGGTGTRKSTALALALSHFGNFTSKSLPASFNDTANFIRKKAFLLKDAPIVVDDYHPVTNMQERKKMEATAQSLSRAFGDGAERGRMKSDLTLQEAMPPRGVAIISGEDTPGVGESGMARFYVVNVRKEDVPVNDDLTAMQELARQGYLQRSMRGYITWLVKQADELSEMLHMEFIRLRTIALDKTQGQHGRTPESIAHMILGYEFMLRYMRDVGVLSDDECLHELEQAWTVLTRNSRQQAKELREERPSKIFLSSIAELLISKMVGVRDLTQIEGEQGSTGRDMIGYMDDNYYYLMPEVAYRAVAKLHNDQGQAFPLTRKMLYKQMKEDGMLTIDTNAETSTRVKWVDGQSQRLLWVPRALINKHLKYPDKAPLLPAPELLPVCVWRDVVTETKPPIGIGGAQLCEVAELLPKPPYQVMCIGTDGEEHSLEFAAVFAIRIPIERAQDDFYSVGCIDSRSAAALALLRTAENPELELYRNSNEIDRSPGINAPEEAELLPVDMEHVFLYRINLCLEAEKPEIERADSAAENSALATAQPGMLESVTTAETRRFMRWLMPWETRSMSSARKGMSMTSP
ncbi:hypothetical protein LJC33_07340 [Eubacteriales bacterium OttesenSCG-928-N13]|nr:hypothetical protein [Eubacteriales bacterium OttesenSCG-928-N13]